MKILGKGKRARQITQRLNQCRKKRTGLTAAVFLVAVFLFVLGGTAWGGYTTAYIGGIGSYGSSGGEGINDAGQVAWSGNGDIFLYSGGVTTQLTDSAANANYIDPRINDSGQVVWQKLYGEPWLSPAIFLYSGGTTTQLGHGGAPQINDAGQVAWSGNGDIFLYSGGVTTQLTDSAANANYIDPRINNSGQVVWSGNAGAVDQYGVPTTEIFLYSGGVTTQLTDNDYDDHSPQINSSGQVVWEGNTGAAEQYGVPTTEIFLYSGGVTTQLTNNDYDDEFPQINSSGQVVWSGNSAADQYDVFITEIFLHSGGVTTRLSDRASWLRGPPQINDVGQVVWSGSGEIFLYSGGTTTQLRSGYYPQINDTGQLLFWEGLWGGRQVGRFGASLILASPCSNAYGKPSLTLSRTRVYWASYADYLARALSVDYSVANTGSDPANDVQITGSWATNGVTLLTELPVSVGDLGGGSGATRTLKYHVPTGVSRFQVLVRTWAKDACGNGYTYP